MAATEVPDEELLLDVQAYYDCEGNKSEAARSRDLKRRTYTDRLIMAQERLGVRLGKVAGGRVSMKDMARRPLPARGHIRRYLLTSIQNNTHIHPGFPNLVAYRDWLDALADASCELIIGTYSYQVAAYGPKAVKRGRYEKRANEGLWYAVEAEPYIVDESVSLAPGLVWCGEQNVLPTTRHPLTAFESYNGRMSNIVPHAKIAMTSVASMADEATKFNYTTGTVTQRHYIQKRAGILAERSHSYGALLVEVDSEGSWWVRQLHIDGDNVIMDVGPDGCPGVIVRDGAVAVKSVVKSIYWGDVHAAESDRWIRNLGWGAGGMLDTTRPAYQFVADIFSMRSRTHHEIRDFHRSYAKHVEGQEAVEDEVRLTADFLNEAVRPWCETVVIPSNHDRQLYRWLNEADFRLDPVNAKYFCELQWQVLDAMDRGDKDFNVLEYALVKAGAPRDVRFLATDESFVIYGAENGLHGDLGLNGAPGSTASLTKLGRAVNKGHDHVAAIRDQVYGAGACATRFSYTKGPSSHSVSNIVTYENEARAILTMWSERWRADSLGGLGAQ